jgi:choline dehydrogenase-like flavoprotein
VLGGSSSLNVLLYHRGNAHDYASWESATGNSPIWDSKSILATFKKSEDYFRGESYYHGTNGELSVDNVRYQNPLSSAYLEACQELTYPMNEDFNDWSHTQEGAGRFQVMERDGARCSAATAFLKPIMKRKNLTILSEALVHKILMNEEKQAVGIEMEFRSIDDHETGESESNQERHSIKLKDGGEVLLAAGAIQSPQLLMLSGIGPKAHLTDHGIHCHIDAPEVGRNLQDHPAAVVSYSAKSEFDGISATSKLRIKNTKILNPKIFLQWLLFRQGVLTSTGCDHGGFFKTKDAHTSPDLQMRFLAAKALSADGMATFSKFRDVPGNNDGISFQSIAIRANSRGSVQLASHRARDAPAIRTGYFNDIEDLHTIREGLKLSRRLATESKALSKYIEEEVFPGPQVKTDAELEDYIRSVSSNVLNMI